MISIKTFNGGIFQTIHVTEDDNIYNDLLKYIKIPPHPRFKTCNNESIYYNITVKPYIKFFHITNEANLNDIIDFDSELTIGFYYEYYWFDWYYQKNRKIGDDFNLPDTSTYDKCKTLIEEHAFNIIFIGDKMSTYELCKLAVQKNAHTFKYVYCQTDEICKLAVRQYGLFLEYVKEQTEEICKLAVQTYGYALEYVNHQTEELCKLAVLTDGGALKYVKEQTEEISKLAVQSNFLALKYVKDPVIKHKLYNK